MTTKRTLRRKLIRARAEVRELQAHYRRALARLYGTEGATMRLLTGMTVGDLRMVLDGLDDAMQVWLDGDAPWRARRVRGATVLPAAYAGCETVLQLDAEEEDYR